MTLSLTSQFILAAHVNLCFSLLLSLSYSLSVLLCLYASELKCATGGGTGGCIKGLSSQIIQILVFDSDRSWLYINRYMHNNCNVSSISYSAFMVLATVFAKFGEHIIHTIV